MSAETAPSFPAPWSNSESAHQTADAIGFLSEVRRWRREAVAWLESSRDDRISGELAAFLLWTLGAAPPPRGKVGPYSVSALPEAALASAWNTAAESTTRNVEAVLVWRAGVVDYLSDVWDTIGPSLFDMEECGVATDLFMPRGLGFDGHCWWCLQPYSWTSGRADHRPVCPIERSLGQPIWPTD